MFMSQYTLSTAEYRFSQMKRVGFSGQLYIAEPRKNNLPKLIIKHADPASACNEFMASRLAELLHIPVPRAYIMDVEPAQKRLFQTPYVVGCEYIEGLRSFAKGDLQNSNVLQQEYADLYALAVMVEQEDITQMSITPEGHLIGIDFSETFFLSDMHHLILSLSEDSLEDLIGRRLRNYLEKNFSLWANAGAKVLADHFGAGDVSDIHPLYLRSMKALLSITKEQIEELTDVLAEVYPMAIVVYFEEYIEILKKKITAYISGLSNNI